MRIQKVISYLINGCIPSYVKADYKKTEPDDNINSSFTFLCTLKLEQNKWHATKVPECVT